MCDIITMKFMIHIELELVTSLVAGELMALLRLAESSGGSWHGAADRNEFIAHVVAAEATGLHIIARVKDIGGVVFMAE
jgi:hypothetical protein